MSQTERLAWIDEKIKHAGGVDARQIVGKFEISERQAKRDIEYMRDRLKAPITYVRERMRYEYMGGFDGLSFAGELAFFELAFVKALVDKSAYIPFIDGSFKKSLDDKMAGFAGVADKVRYELPELERPRGAVAQALCASLRRNGLLRLDYVNSRGERSERDILPLVLVNYGGKWYCVALDEAKGAIRTFSLARIRELRDIKRSGKRPPEEEVERYLSASYGIFKGERLGFAKLRMSGAAARAVRDQTWHAEQRLRVVAEEPDPVIELEVPAHDWSELLGKALTCGSRCEVLAPEDFRALWKAEIARMAALASD